MEKINLVPQTQKGLKIAEYEKKYTLDAKGSFIDINSVISLMGNFAISNVSSTYHLDFYYDTPDGLLKKFNACVRLREEPNKNTLSIKYITYYDNEDNQKVEVAKEFYRDVPKGVDIAEDEDSRIFLDDKLREIYAHHVDLDLLRKLKQLRPILVIRTDRTAQIVKNNDNFVCRVCFDETQYKTKRQYDFENILEIKLECMPTDENLFFYEMFLKELRTRCVLIPMLNTKYDVGCRVSKYEKNKRKKFVNEEEETNAKDKKK